MAGQEPKHYCSDLMSYIQKTNEYICKIAEEIIKFGDNSDTVPEVVKEIIGFHYETFKKLINITNDLNNINKMLELFASPEKIKETDGKVSDDLRMIFTIISIQKLVDNLEISNQKNDEKNSQIKHDPDCPLANHNISPREPNLTADSIINMKVQISDEKEEEKEEKEEDLPILESDSETD